MARTVGDVIAGQIRLYRKKRDMTVRQLADECARIAPGSELTLASLTNIERGQDPAAKRGGRDVAMAELLTIAAALRIPPIMLVCPVTSSGEPIEVIPGAEMGPQELLAWINGDQSPLLRVLRSDYDYDTEFAQNAFVLRATGRHQYALEEAMRALAEYQRAAGESQMWAARAEEIEAEWEMWAAQNRAFNEMDRQDPNFPFEDAIQSRTNAQRASATHELAIEYSRVNSALSENAKAEFRRSLDMLASIRSTMRDMNMKLTLVPDQLIAASTIFPGMPAALAVGAPNGLGVGAPDGR